MEPGLQPSFTFPSRNQTHNLAQGLLNQAAATQLLLIKPKRATDIDLITSLESPLSIPKTLDKDSIDPKPQLPVATPIYVQPGLAEGMTQLAMLTKADVDITQLLSANNALKRGNYRAAENILGRELTQEEIANRTITPLVRTSEANPNSKIHLSESEKQLGAPMPGESLGTYEQRRKAFQHADEQLINTIAMHLNMSPRAVSELKSNLNFDGNSVLGFVKGDAYHRKQVIDLFKYHWDAWKGKSKEERAEILRNRSILEGENRPIHSGAKGKKSEAQYRRDLYNFSRENPYGNFGNPYGEYTKEEEAYFGREEEKQQVQDAEAIGQPQNSALPYVSGEQQLYESKEFSGESRGIAEQYADSAPGYQQYTSDSAIPQAPDVTPQGKQFVQEQIGLNEQLQRAILEGIKLRPKKDTPDVEMESPNAQKGLMADLQEQLRKRRGNIEVVEAPVDPDDWNDEEDRKTGIENRQKAVEDAEMKNEHKGPEHEYPYVTIAEANLVKSYALTEDKQRNDLLANIIAGPLNHRVGMTQIQKMALQHERGELLTREEVQDMKMIASLLQGRGGVSFAEGEFEHRGGKRQKGGSIRPRRRMKKQSFTPYSREQGLSENERWIPRTSSLDPQGAVISGRLMRNTGVNAVPISAQLQVSNTHQYVESPLLDWVKHPNLIDEVRPGNIPVSQYVSKKSKPSKKLGVQAAQRKVTFGGYLLDHHKLMHENTLSIMHPSGNKVKGMKNERVSNGLRDAVHAVLTGQSINKRRLSPEDKLKLQTLLKKSKADVDLGGEVNVTPHKQLQLIMGEIEAGNDAPQLKTQLRKLLPILTSGGKISKEQADSIRSHFL